MGPYRPEEVKIATTYEVMIIAIPELSDEQLENTFSRVQTIVQRTGGEVLDFRQWGKRRFAYEIDDRSEGYYAVMQFTAGDRTIGELKRIMKVSDDVLRNMLVKLPPYYDAGHLEEAEADGA